jgi:hypothetical protein
VCAWRFLSAPTRAELVLLAHQGTDLRRHAYDISIKGLAPDEARPAGIGTIGAATGLYACRRSAVFFRDARPGLMRDAHKIVRARRAPHITGQAGRRRRSGRQRALA